jgi:hypothetical protein
MGPVDCGLWRISSGNARELERVWKVESSGKREEVVREAAQST